MNTQNIPGVPVGTKIVAVRVPKEGEYYLDLKGGPSKGNDDMACTWPILAPDNAYGVIDLSAMPVPEGYERDGESIEEWYRAIESNKYFTDAYNPTQARSGYGYAAEHRIILRKTLPKTRRVLVVEYEEPTNTYLSRFDPTGDLESPGWFKSRTRRIENRPLSQ